MGKVVDQCRTAFKPPRYILCCVCCTARKSQEGQCSLGRAREVDVPWLEAIPQDQEVMGSITAERYPFILHLFLLLSFISRFSLIRFFYL